jgi:cell division protein FtsB
MRQPKTSGTTFVSSQPAPWMKAVFVVEAALLVLIVLFGWEQWDDAQRELAIKTRDLKAKQESNSALARENDNSYQFLTKYTNDEEFRNRVARQRLGYTAPGEVVFRLDPPPKPSNPPQDSSGK